ncbi:thiosulfate sulfurtransferase GlpE [Alteromonas halophila]|uniref:Thiosulfate sulfurtransferase GlpE n=1 Tax=Alteromonas halophila TaxID=516698 RepID=A0A918MYH8_9ALTE|nr:thiosulfate sulfurtransferase GlpE [Alteromonas halophila]GGW85118.1 thiosulfate sulfurtransferase GlpE [Alteromonas halophila]
MQNFSHISVDGVLELDSTPVIVDIRDPQSFANGRMPEAIHLSNDNFASFINETPKTQPVVVVCYHGISSQQAADIIAQQGFVDVYSMDGGFEAWHSQGQVVETAS